jgi:predicted HTH transcriptional regulator
MAVQSGRLSVADEKENIKNILEKLKLINKNKLTNASIILFGKNPLKAAHPSVACNPLIVHIFYLVGLVEEYGSGIGRMIQSLKETNLPGPEFKEEFNGFSLYIRKNIYTREKLIALDLNERQIKKGTLPHLVSSPLRKG